MTGLSKNFEIGESINEPNIHRCHLALVHEDDGTVSAIVLNLPRVGSCGDAVTEAIANASEAASTAIKSFLDDNAEIPWLEPGNYSIPGKV